MAVPHIHTGPLALSMSAPLQISLAQIEMYGATAQELTFHCRCPPVVLAIDLGRGQIPSPKGSRSSHLLAV